MRLGACSACRRQVNVLLQCELLAKKAATYNYVSCVLLLSRRFARSGAQCCGGVASTIDQSSTDLCTFPLKSALRVTCCHACREHLAAVVAGCIALATAAHSSESGAAADHTAAAAAIAEG
jgi:hypothetical protein